MHGAAPQDLAGTGNARGIDAGGDVPQTPRLRRRVHLDDFQRPLGGRRRATALGLSVRLLERYEPNTWAASGITNGKILRKPRSRMSVSKHSAFAHRDNRPVFWKDSTEFVCREARHCGSPEHGVSSSHISRQVATPTGDAAQTTLQLPAVSARRGQNTANIHAAPAGAPATKPARDQLTSHAGPRGLLRVTALT